MLVNLLLEIPSRFPFTCNIHNAHIHEIYHEELKSKLDKPALKSYGSKSMLNGSGKLAFTLLFG